MKEKSRGFFIFLVLKIKKIRIPIGLQTVTDRLLICILLFFLGDIINQRNPIPGGRTGSKCQVIFSNYPQLSLHIDPATGLSQIRLLYPVLRHIIFEST